MRRRDVRPRTLAGILIAVVASVIATTAVVVIAQRGTNPEENKSPPSKALHSDQITKLPAGTPVAGLSLPYTFGSIRVLPVGSVPAPPADAVPPEPGLTVTRVDLIEGTTQSECQAFGLALTPAYIPRGWGISGCSQNTITWSDGEMTDISYFAGFTRDGYYPVSISRRLLAPGELVDVVNDGDPFALTLAQVGGTQAVIRHQAPGAKVNGPFSVTFVTGGIVTEVESAGIDIDELVRVAAAISNATRSAQQ
jgi:hypothetical protein